MVKLTQRIRQLLPTNCLSVFENFVGLDLKGLITVIYPQSQYGTQKKKIAFDFHGEKALYI